jgi:hypothetical protein
MILNDEKPVEFIDEKPKSREQPRRGLLKEFLDGTLLTRENVVRQLPYILFLTILAVIYIGNRYHAEKVIRKTLTLQNELKELRSEEITKASALMYLSKQSEVARMVEEHGLELKESTKPPKKISASRKELEE